MASTSSSSVKCEDPMAAEPRRLVFDASQRSADKLDAFLQSHSPSNVHRADGIEWISVHGPQYRRQPEEAEGIDGLKQAWEDLKHSGRPITHNSVLNLAKAYNCLSGKWLFHMDSGRKVDRAWASIARAVVAGECGMTAKVSTYEEPGGRYSQWNQGTATHVICVYNRSFTDKAAVNDLADQIRRAAGIRCRMTYKPEVFSYLGIYSSNQWRLRPVIYASDYGQDVIQVKSKWQPRWRWSPSSSEEESEESSEDAAVVEESDQAKAAAAKASEQSRWIVFDSAESSVDELDTFLQTSSPSVVQRTDDIGWIIVRSPQYAEEQPWKVEDEDKAGLQQAWEDLQHSGRSITHNSVLDLAKEYNCLSGKWLFHMDTGINVDHAWSNIARAVVAGECGMTAKVSPFENTGGAWGWGGGSARHVICVYNKDFTDRAAVQELQRQIRQAGIRCKMTYKPEAFTYLGIYSSNQWHLRSVIYTSNYGGNVSRAKSNTRQSWFNRRRRRRYSWSDSTEEDPDDDDDDDDDGDSDDDDDEDDDVIIVEDVVDDNVVVITDDDVDEDVLVKTENVDKAVKTEVVDNIDIKTEDVDNAVVKTEVDNVVKTEDVKTEVVDNVVKTEVNDDIVKTEVIDSVVKTEVDNVVKTEDIKTEVVDHVKTEVIDNIVVKTENIGNIVVKTEDGSDENGNKK